MEYCHWNRLLIVCLHPYMTCMGAEIRLVHIHTVAQWNKTTHMQITFINLIKKNAYAYIRLCAYTQFWLWDCARLNTSGPRSRTKMVWGIIIFASFFGGCVFFWLGFRITTILLLPSQSCLDEPKQQLNSKIQQSLTAGSCFQGTKSRAYMQLCCHDVQRATWHALHSLQNSRATHHKVQ